MEIDYWHVRFTHPLQLQTVAEQAYMAHKNTRELPPFLLEELTENGDGVNGTQMLVDETQIPNFSHNPDRRDPLLRVFTWGYSSEPRETNGFTVSIRDESAQRVVQDLSARLGGVYGKGYVPRNY